MIKYLDLKKITELHADEIHTTVSNVVDSGWYLHGVANRLFEEHYARYIGTKHCIGCGNGLDALTLILRAYMELGVMKRGDEVIVPANTYIASILSITANGLVPVLVEPRPDTFQIDDTLIESAITDRTRAIMIVHLYGKCAYTERIKDICQRHSLKLIEDNAQAHGTTFLNEELRIKNEELGWGNEECRMKNEELRFAKKGVDVSVASYKNDNNTSSTSIPASTAKKNATDTNPNSSFFILHSSFPHPNSSLKRTGSLGDAAAHSFYPGKNLGALGDAGAVTTDDEELAGMIRTLANYGSSVKYVFPYEGMNSRMDELHAAVLDVKLSYLDEDNEARRRVALHYIDNVKNPLLNVPGREYMENNVFHIFPVMCKERDRLQKYLSEHGVQTVIHYPIPPHKQECYRQLGHLDLPVTERIHREELSIPCNQVLTEEEVGEVTNLLNKFI
ncbi:DegT/DnrJ/EryC1/StrS family aminotransferase [Xylanibacter caecicola]|uniref:DegT/DnrJ/EryC1/StrS family aminotransferase n=1 Tax=Xylanibacter caecicola TaxID=2736294 RepID=UPI0025855A55|nr:DegT/DnrJ/EryC1/StrS family aminotransferase [Xylanibacter caecicola]